MDWTLFVETLQWVEHGVIALLVLALLLAYGAARRMRRWPAEERLRFVADVVRDRVRQVRLEGRVHVELRLLPRGPAATACPVCRTTNLFPVTNPSSGEARRMCVRGHEVT